MVTYDGCKINSYLLLIYIIYYSIYFIYLNFNYWYIYCALNQLLSITLLLFDPVWRSLGLTFCCLYQINLTNCYTIEIVLGWSLDVTSP